MVQLSGYIRLILSSEPSVDTASLSSSAAHIAAIVRVKKMNGVVRNKAQSKTQLIHKISLEQETQMIPVPNS